MKRSIDQPLIVGALLVVGLLLAACGGSPTATMVPPAGTTATATPAATAPGPSPTAAVEPSATQAPPPAATDTPVPSATPAPTSPPQPTATQQPTATNQPAAERISFAAGATSATVEGSLAAQGTDSYVLKVMAGQLMEVSVDPQDKVQLIVYGADGTVLKSGMGGVAFFRGTVPSTQDYLVDVGPGTEATSFTMSVIIPVRISFAPGATSTLVEGNLAAHQTRQYVLRASGGQTMEVNATPAGQVRLIIYGADGAVLLSGMGDVASFSGTLPSDQDYIVAVQAGPGAAAYTLEISIQ